MMIESNEGLDYSELARKYLKRSKGVGGDGLIVMDGRSMKFYNPDGSKVPFCGNGTRVFFYYLYLLGEVEKEDEIETEAGKVRLTYKEKNLVSVEMPEVNVEKSTEEGVLVRCGVPHLIRTVNDIDKVAVEEEGERLSQLLGNGNNVDWVEKNDNTLKIRTFERGVNGETLSCASGIASVSFYILESMKKKECSIETPGGEFHAFINERNRIQLTGGVNILFRGEIFEKEENWEIKEILKKG